MRAESKAYIQDPERMQQDYTNFKINEAIKGSMDQLNGRTTGASETLNGNGAGMAAGPTTVNVEHPQLHHASIDAAVAHHQYPIPSQHQEKKNTDV